MLVDNGGDAGVLGGSWGLMTANYRGSVGVQVLSTRRSGPTDSVVAKSLVIFTGHILDIYVHLWSSPLWYNFTHPRRFWYRKYGASFPFSLRGRLCYIYLIAGSTTG